MKQNQLLMIALFTTSVGMNAMQQNQQRDSQENASAPIAIPDNNNHATTYDKELEETATSSPNEAGRDLSRNDDYSELHSHRAYSYEGSAAGEYYNFKASAAHAYTMKSRHKNKHK